MKYFALLTKLGENLLAQATALGTKLELTHMAVGDGGGSLPTPDTNQTKLIAEKRRAAINTLFIDDKNKNQIIAEQIIPEQDGGWWIREIGLFDKAGNLIAVANCPETYKPQLEEGSGRTQSIRMVLIVSHTESVTLKIDPSVVLATREYVNTEITVLDKKIDALSAQTKLDLTKKIDKANISGQKGNDNDKVPSLNLFTTEIGKLAALGYSYSKIESDGRYQPKGNYAPAGDYATNAALTNGLNGKFDKTGGVIAGGITVTGNTTSNGDVIQVVNAKNNQSIQLDTTNDGLARINSRQKNEQTYTHLLPSASGIFMQLGDYGFAGRGLLYNYSQSALETTLFKDSTLSQIFRNDTTNTLTYRYSPSLLMRTGDTSALISVDVDTANVRATSVLLTNGTRKTNELYGTANTKVDRNGYLRAANSAEELIGVPIGGSVLWNGVWDENDPLAEFFWPNEGRSFSASAYPIAAKRFPSLKLPDDRGYAIRIADNGKGVDPGRVVGTYQEDAMQNLTGEFTARTDSAGIANGVFTKESPGQTMSQGNNNILGTVSFSAANQVRTANEFRMKNVAKILITRMK